MTKPTKKEVLSGILKKFSPHFKKNEISLVNMYYSEGQRTKEIKATPLLNPNDGILNLIVSGFPSVLSIHFISELRYYFCKLAHKKEN